MIFYRIQISIVVEVLMQWTNLIHLPELVATTVRVRRPKASEQQSLQWNQKIRLGAKSASEVLRIT